MGVALSSPSQVCSSIERKEATNCDTDLQAFDRSLLAQVKKGKLEDNYDILEELGSGSFGVVNKARDVRTKCVSMATFVAVKTIPKKKISDPKTVKDEFNVLRQLDHAHICKAYECYEDRRNIYLVMDICSGGTLLESLCVLQRFPETDAANIMRQTLSALSYLHQANFIFRDLKTENIMFARPVTEGEVGNVKLIDFGLCCPFRPGAKITRAAGTPYSVAPELVTAPVSYDQRCDSWSAGVVMFIILSGQYPFNGKTKEELLHRIRKEPVSFKSPRWKKITKDCKTILVELLRKKPENRFSVADALEHPWLQADYKLPDRAIMEVVVATMVEFQSLNMLQKAAMTALAWRACDEDTKHLRQIFEYLDRDGNGHVTMPELRGAFEVANVKLPESLNIGAVGTDGNDTIEYTEFLAAALNKNRILKESVVWEAFKIFDADGSGSVTKAELCKLLTGRTTTQDNTGSSKAIEAFLDSYDTSGDGVVDFDEFMNMLGDSGKPSENRVAVAGNAASTENSYFGICSTMSSATPEKKTVSPSPPGTSARRSSRKEGGLRSGR